MGYARFYEMFDVVLWHKVELTAAFNYLDVTTTTVVVEYNVKYRIDIAMIKRRRKDY